jgi:hypothetical protein
VLHQIPVLQFQFVQRMVESQQWNSIIKIFIKKVSQIPPVLTTKPEELADWPMAYALRVTRLCQYLFAEGLSKIASRAVCCAPLVQSNNFYQ